MGSNEIGHPDEPGVPDHPSSGGGAHDARRAGDAHTDRAQKAGRPSHGQRAAEGASAESLNREEYSDKTRGRGPPIPTDRPGHDGFRAGEDDLRAGQRERPADTASSVKTDGYQAEPLGRAVYAEHMRAGTGDPAPADLHAGPGQDGPGVSPAGLAESDAEPAEPRSRDDYAATVRAESSGEPGLAEAAGDGTAGAQASSPHPGETCEAPGPGAAALPRPETVTIDGKEIVVTHDRADGLWAEGLPGEPPGRVGDVLAGANEAERARGERLFRKAIEHGDNLLDSMEKNINLGHDALRPPVHAEVPVSVPGSGHDVPHHEIDAGNAATAALTLGLLTWAAGNWVARKLKGNEDAGHR
jgi:hypothetical protein